MASGPITAPSPSPRGSGESSLHPFAEPLDTEVDQKVERARDEIELQRHEVAADDLLRPQEELTHSDDGEERRGLHQLGPNVDPHREDLAERLRQQHEGEDLRELQPEAARRLRLAFRNCLQRATNDLAD